MLPASLRLRFTAALLAFALAMLSAVPGFALGIDFSLNVIYTNPSDTSSGGTWELVAKSTPDTFGIASFFAYVRNVNNDAVLEAPRATVNGANPAGFQLLGNVFHPAEPPTPPFREYIIGQVPLLPLPSGSEENVFYGVGTLANGAPNYPTKPAGSNSIGPAFASLTNPQDIAWATSDIFNDPNWSTAARMLSGTFPTGMTPLFFNGSGGNVFTSVPGSNTAIGNSVLATAITTIVRTNALANSADYNQNGIVDAADYVLWRKTQGLAAVPPGSGADGNHDGTINQPDYDLWRSHFGNPSGSGSGGGLSTGAVPEPASGLLLAIGALAALARRRSRFES